MALAFLGGCGEASNARLGDKPLEETWRGDRVHEGTIPSRPVSTHMPVVPKVEARLAQNFSLLNTASEGLPQSIAKVLRRPTYGINFALAQRIPVRTATTFWAVPGNRFICIVSQENDRSVSQVCAPTHVAIKRGLASVIIDRPNNGGVANRLIVGLATDDSTSVRIPTEGLTRIARVIKNVFMVRDTNYRPPDKLILSRDPR